MLMPKSTITVRILSMALLIVMLLTPVASSIASPTDQAVDGLFTDADAEVGLRAVDDPTIVRARLVNINFDLLGAGDAPPEVESDLANTLLLNLFEDVIFTALLDRVELNSSGTFSWIGHLEGVEFSQVTLVVKDRVMAGNITMPEAFYQVRYVGDDVHAIYQIDQSAFPPEREPIPVDTSQEDSDEAAPIGMADDGSTIDVMVVYTAAARSAAGGTTAMNTLIALAVSETNTSYANSGIVQRVNLVHTQEVTYSETGFNWNQALDRLTGTSDGYMDNVHTLRNTYHADQVVLIVEDTAYCGLAWQMTTVSASFEAYAFSLVCRTCATGYYSFAHEMGHNQGARHDWYVDQTTNSPYPYNKGYVKRSAYWRTVMAYNTECDDHGVYCYRLQYFSNPNVSYYGVPMGVAEGQYHAADNRKTLNNTRFTVANFRTGGPHYVNPRPNMPSGPWGGYTGQPLCYTTGGTVDSQGHPVQYRFFWGDGNVSPFVSSNACNIYTVHGTYYITVRGYCALNHSIMTRWFSPRRTVKIIKLPWHYITRPQRPSGPWTGRVGQTLCWTTGGSVDALGHSPHYRMFFGDGSASGWSSSTTFCHAFSSPGTYYLFVRASCPYNHSIKSKWDSYRRAVTIGWW